MINDSQIGNHTKLVWKIATERDEVLDALALVHGEYVNTGLSVANRFGVRVTRYHLMNTTDILTGVADGMVACTMSLVRDNPLGLPMESIYREQVDARRRAGKKLAEATCLADQRSDPKRTLKMIFSLISLAAQASPLRGVDEIVAAVHPRHGRFYERFFGFVPMGGLKQHTGVLGNPAIALRVDLSNLHKTDPKAYERAYGEPYPSDVLKPRSISPELLDELRWLYEATATPQPIAAIPVPANPMPSVTESAPFPISTFASLAAD